MGPEDPAEKPSELRLGGSMAQNENCDCLFHTERDGLHIKRVKRKDYGGHLALRF
jgi:hypothetical protein